MENQRVMGLLAGFRRQLRFIPAGDSVGHVLDVRVAQFLRRACRLRVGAALGAAAIGDDQRAFIRRQAGGQVVLDGGPAQRAGHMTGLVGRGAVGVDYHGGLGIGRGLDVFHADVGKSTGVNRGRTKCYCHESDKFFHIRMLVG